MTKKVYCPSRCSRFLILLLVLFTISCKKDTVEDPVSPGSFNLVKSITGTGTGVIDFFRYDSGMRIAYHQHLAFAYGLNCNDIMLYKYKDRSFFSEYHHYYPLVDYYSGIMIGNRLIFAKRTQSGNPDTIRISYTYDNDGYLISEKGISDFYGLEFEYNYTILNGNIVTIEKNKFMPNFSRDTIEYYDALNTINFPHTGKTFLGHPSKNLPKRITGQSITDFFYEFDESGRVRTMTIDTGNVLQSIKIFTYY